MGVSGLAAQAFGQQAAAAPTSAQRFETRFRVERFSHEGILLSSNFASNLPHLDEAITYDTAAAVGRVDITYQGRVGILPNTSGTVNLGITRLGGAGSATTGGRISFVDAVAQGALRNQGSLTRAQVPGTSNSGEPNVGMFGPFRGAFAGWSFAGNGNNTDAGNGSISNPATGSPVLSNFTGGRAQNFGDGPGGDPTDTDGFNGSGPAAGAALIDGTTLSGDFADYYKLTYVVSANDGDLGARMVNGRADGQSGRYLFRYNGGGATSNGQSVNLPTTFINFAIPAPTAAAPLGLAALALARRRRRR